MDEKIEEKAEDKKSEEKPKDNGEGNLPKTTPLIDIANAAAERMEKANEETARLLARQEELEQRKALGGRTEAGQESKPVEESSEDYANRVMNNGLK